MENGFRSNPKYKEKYFLKKLFHEIQVLESPRQASRQIDRWTDRQGDKKINGRDTDRQICCRRWWYYDVISPYGPAPRRRRWRFFWKVVSHWPATCWVSRGLRVEKVDDSWDECWDVSRAVLYNSCTFVQIYGPHTLYVDPSFSTRWNGFEPTDSILTLSFSNPMRIYLGVPSSLFQTAWYRHLTKSYLF